MKRIAIALLFVATNASACITVALPPREFLHGATRVFRGVATEVFTFRVTKIYRGDDNVGEETAALLDILGCGQGPVNNSDEYLVVEWPNAKYARARTVATSKDDIAFLESHEKPITRDELTGHLRSLHGMKAWLDSAKTRDVDDWSDEGSLTSTILVRLRSVYDRSTSPDDVVRQYVRRIILLLETDVGLTDTAIERCEELFEEMGDRIEAEEDDAP